MGRSGTSHQDHHRRDRKNVKDLENEESNHDRKKRHEDRSSHRRRHRRHDDREDEEGIPRRRSHDSDDEKYGSKNSSSKGRSMDKHNSKRRKTERENVHVDRRKRRERENRKHRRRDAEDDDERRSFDDSHDAKKRKRHRNDDDDDKEQRKSRKHKHHAHRDRERKELPSETTKLQVDKSSLFPLGDKLGHPPDTLLDPENDYFEQNQRLRLYLYRECGLTFDDLSSAEARKSFHEFVQRYNTGELETGYYSAILPVEAVEQCPSTRHQWSLKLSNHDSQNLQMVQMGIRKQTEYQAHESTDTAENSGTAQLRTLVEPRANPMSVSLSNEAGALKVGTNDRARNRQLREESQLVMEEFTGGRAIGHERLMEKRQERASQIHGASKYAPEVELDDTALYGGGSSDDFRRALAESQKRAAAQEAKKQAHIEELKQKEEEKKSAMLEMLGLSHKIGQSKIKIPPRNDPS